MRTTRPPTHRLLIVATIALAVAAGCSDEQRRDLGSEDMRDALTKRVEQAVDDNGLEIDGDLQCTADIGDDSAATGSCSGPATTGIAVVGTFTGTADVDAETCSARLLVELDAEAVVDEPDADCFDVG